MPLGWLFLAFPFGLGTAVLALGLRIDVDDTEVFVMGDEDTEVMSGRFVVRVEDPELDFRVGNKEV